MNVSFQTVLASSSGAETDFLQAGYGRMFRSMVRSELHPQGSLEVEELDPQQSLSVCRLKPAPLIITGSRWADVTGASTPGVTGGGKGGSSAESVFLLGSVEDEKFLQVDFCVWFTLVLIRGQKFTTRWHNSTFGARFYTIISRQFWPVIHLESK